MKSKTKGKKATLKRERSTTGGGPQTKVEFKGIEEQMDELITNTEAFGDESIEESATDFVFSNGTMRQISIHSLLHDDRFEDEIENEDRIEDGNKDIQNVQNKEPNIDEESIEEEGNGKSIIKPVELPKEGTKQNDKEEKNYSTKKKKKLSVPAQRLKKSVTEASKLVDVSRDTYALKKWYYERKIMCLQRITCAVEKYCGISEEDYPVQFLDEV